MALTIEEIRSLDESKIRTVLMKKENLEDIGKKIKDVLQLPTDKLVALYEEALGGDGKPAGKKTSARKTSTRKTSSKKEAAAAKGQTNGKKGTAGSVDLSEVTESLETIAGAVSEINSEVAGISELRAHIDRRFDRIEHAIVYVHAVTIGPVDDPSDLFGEDEDEDKEED